MSQQVLEKSNYYTGLAKRKWARQNFQVPSSNEEALRTELESTHSELQTTQAQL